MQVAIGGRAPEPLRATLTLSGRREAPRWRLLARSEGFDPGLLAGGTPMEQVPSFELDAHGNGGAARLRRPTCASEVPPGPSRGTGAQVGEEDGLLMWFSGHA